MTKHFCDRCGKEIDKWERKYLIEWGRFITEYMSSKTKSACLCKGCYWEFEDYLGMRKPENKEENEHGLD